MERVRSIEGLDLRVRLEGHRTPVVLVHGAMDRSSAFLRVARTLSDHPVLVYDRRGYGRSTIEPSSCLPDFDTHVHDLQAAVHLLGGLTGRRPLLVGHSLGGSIALVAACRQPSTVAGLLLFESPLLWESWWPPVPASTSGDGSDAAERAAEQFMRSMFGDSLWESLPEATRRRRRAEGPVLCSELESGRSLEPPGMSELDLPVVVGLGSGADTLRRRASEAVVQAVPRGELHLLEGADHNAHSGDPRRFAALVAHFARIAATE